MEYYLQSTSDRLPAHTTSTQLTAVVANWQLNAESLHARWLDNATKCVHHPKPTASLVQWNY